MRYTLLTVMLVAAMGLGAACSPPAAGSATNSTGAGSIPMNTAVDVSTVNSNVSAANANAVDPPGSVADKANRQKQNAEGGPAGPPPPLQFQHGAEDSQFATTMTREGQFLQIRLFNSHPEIAKVESTWLGSTEKMLKVYLRGGKIVDVKTDKIGDLRFATTAALLDIAGIKPGAADGGPATVEKKPAQ